MEDIDGGFAGTLKVYNLYHPDKPDAAPQRVIILPQPTAKTFQLATNFRVGSNAETEETNGYAHFVEHNAFKGTTDEAGNEIYGVGGYDKIMEEVLNADVNASTSRDKTDYVVYNVVAELAEKAIDAHAPFAQGFAFPEEGIKGEKGTVIEEIKRAGDLLTRRLVDSIYKDSFGDHPNARNVLGPEINIRNATRDSVRAFYLQNYGPGNRTVIAIGNIDPDRIIHKIAESYNMNLDGFSDKSYVAPTFEPRPEGLIRKEMALGDMAPTDGLVMWQVVGPDARKPREVIVWDLISNLIGGSGSKASLGNLELVEGKRLFRSLSTGAGDIVGGSPLLIFGRVKAEKIKEAEDGLRSILHRIKTGQISEEDLDLAKAQLEMGYVSSINGGRDGQLDSLAHYDKTDSLRELYGERYLKLLNAVTLTDIAATAKTYMVPGRTVEYAIVGKAKSPEEMPATVKFGASSSLSIASKSPTPNKLRFSGRVDNGITHKTSEGMNVVVKKPNEDRVQTVITVTIPKIKSARPGELELLAALIGKRTAVRDTNAFAKQIVRNRVRVAASVSDDALNIHIFGNSLQQVGDRMTTGNPKRFEGMADILHEVMTQPFFDADDVAHKADGLAAGYRSILAETPVDEASIEHQGNIYPADHKYGATLARSAENFPHITADRLLQLFKEVSKAPKTVAVVGHVEPSLVISKMDVLSRDLGIPEASTELQKATKTPRLSRHSLLIKVRKQADAEPQKHSEIFKSWQVPGLVNGDATLKLKLIQFVLSGGMSTRLFQEFREKQDEGLCYQVYSRMEQQVDENLFTLYVGGSHENLPKLLRLFDKEILKLRQAPVSELELRKAKDTFKQTFLTIEDEVDTQSREIANHVQFGYPSREELMEAMDKISVADLQKTAQMYLSKPSKTTVLTTVETAEKLGAPINKEIGYYAWQQSLKQKGNPAL